MTSKYLPLLVVDTRKVAVNNSMVGAEIQCSQVCSNRPGAQRTTCKGKRKQALHNADRLVSITTTLTLLKRHSFLLEKHHQRNKERNNNKQNLNTRRTFCLPIYSNFQPAFSLSPSMQQSLGQTYVCIPLNFKRQMTMAVLFSISTVLFSFCVPNWIHC